MQVWLNQMFCDNIMSYMLKWNINIKYEILLFNPLRSFFLTVTNVHECFCFLVQPWYFTVLGFGEQHYNFLNSDPVWFKDSVQSEVRSALESYVLHLHLCCYYCTLYVMGQHFLAFRLVPLMSKVPELLQKHDTLPNKPKEKISHTLRLYKGSVNSKFSAVKLYPIMHFSVIS